MACVHGTCVDLGTAAVLLQGPSGSGKSDLALRLIDGGARLVADDQVELRVQGGGLWVSAPEALAGLIEVRGVGLVRLPRVAEARLRLVANLVPPQDVERMPEPTHCELEGVTLPKLKLTAFEPSAPAKLRLVVRSLDDDIRFVGS